MITLAFSVLSLNSKDLWICLLVMLTSSPPPAVAFRHILTFWYACILSLIPSGSFYVKMLLFSQIIFWIVNYFNFKHGKDQIFQMWINRIVFENLFVLQFGNYWWISTTKNKTMLGCCFDGSGERISLSTAEFWEKDTDSGRPLRLSLRVRTISLFLQVSFIIHILFS